jgi:hypothetical protein
MDGGGSVPEITAAGLHAMELHDLARAHMMIKDELVARINQI